jgi:AcrR family transcriptional regulator
MAPTAATAAPSPSAGRRARSGGGSPRLGADDWVQAALDVMEEEGIAGVKVPRLCARLGVTKGSFYWHFADFDTFLGAVARRWAEEGARLPGVLEADTFLDTEALLLHAMRLFAEPRNRNLARAMRDWAQHDERAREAIRRADEELFARLTEVMVRYGFDEDEAELRAKILYYSGVGYAHVGDLGRRASAEGQLRKTWQLLTQP